MNPNISIQPSAADAYRAMLAECEPASLAEAALKTILPTKENKARLESFMKKFNTLRAEFPDVVIRGTHDEKVKAGLLDGDNIVQYLGSNIDFVFKK